MPMTKCSGHPVGRANIIGNSIPIAEPGSGGTSAQQAGSYADVPPTVGSLKGNADTELQVRVRITPSEAVLPPDQEFAADQEWSQFLQETGRLSCCTPKNNSSELRGPSVSRMEQYRHFRAQ
jgi:hypothetical protein